MEIRSVTDDIYRLLLVEDNPEQAQQIQDYLDKMRSPRFQVEHVATVPKAKALLATQSFDAVLLEMELADCSGLEAVDKLTHLWRLGPLVALTAIEDDTMGSDAVRHGAHDYITRDTLSAALLSRTLCFAIAQHRNQQTHSMPSPAEDDQLTQLCQTLRGQVSLLLGDVAEMAEQLLSLRPGSVEYVERTNDNADRIMTLLNQTALPK